MCCTGLKDVSKLGFPLETSAKCSQPEPEISNVFEETAFSLSFTPRLLLSSLKGQFLRGLELII